MSIGYLHVTINESNNHAYVGQSSKLDERSIENYIGSGDYLREAVEKYGRESFTKQIVAYFDDQTDLDYAELFLIAQCRANNIALYNGGVGGPRAESGFIAAMFQKFAVMPQMAQAW